MKNLHHKGALALPDLKINSGGGEFFKSPNLLIILEIIKLYISTI
jgi:hypothetical protein